MKKKNKGFRQGGRQNERPDTELQVTSPSAWKTPEAAGDLLELPSGNVVRCIRPGMQGFIEIGIVPNPLLPIVDQSLKEHKLMTVDEIIDDQSTLLAAAEFTDNVVMHCVTSPKIYPTPDVEKDEPWEEGRLYLSQVTEEDKVFIFQFSVGGTRSVQRFRESQAADVATLAAEQLDRLAPQQSA